MVGDGFVVAYEKDGTWYILPYVFCSFIRNAFFENKYLFRYNSKIITLKCKRLSKYIFYSSFSLLTFATKK